MPRGAALRSLTVLLGLFSALWMAKAAGSSPPGFQLGRDPQFNVLTAEGPGLTLTSGGVGLEDLGTGSRTLRVEIGGPVQRAFLYWSTRDFSCEGYWGDGYCSGVSTGDQVLKLDGHLVTGSSIGSEYDAIGYRAEVTNLVRARLAAEEAASYEFTVEDGDLQDNAERLNGASLVILFQDPAEAQVYRVTLNDGVDFAWEGWQGYPGHFEEWAVCRPVTFVHGAQSLPRTAQVRLLVGDADTDLLDPSRPRPDRIRISHHPEINYSLDADDGASWDDDWVSVTIPAGEASTSVQLFSERVTAVDTHADSLIWTFAALRVPAWEPASLGDQVWEDLNRNGILEEGEAGLPGITVNLLDGTGQVVAATVTDDDGSYQFNGLAPADYRVQVVSPPGYLLTLPNQGGNESADSDADPADGDKTALTLLRSGETDLTWDAGLRRRLYYRTNTIGGWGAPPSGNNTGALLHRQFATIYPKGLTVGGKKTARFTDAQAIADFLPSTGTPGVLTRSYLNPVGRTSAGGFLSQVLALQLNVDFSRHGMFPAGLSELKLVSGPEALRGWSVSQLLRLANQVLGGGTGALPAGVSVSELHEVIDAINNNFIDGEVDHGSLTP